VHGPKLVFLDEPTNGLDPKGRDEMLKLIEDVKERGVNVVLSSHLLPDVERVCDSVIMLNQGKLVHFGPIANITGEGESIVEVETKNANAELKKVLEKAGYTVTEEGLRLSVSLASDADPFEILRHAVEADIQVRHFMPGELTLETAFLGFLERADH